MSDKLYWHFLPDDGRLANGDGRQVQVGETLRIEGEPVLCKHGFHASENILDALGYAPGALICRVRLGGKIIEDADKAVAAERTVLWMANAERELRLFACWSVRNTPLADGRTVWDLLADKRSQTAVEVAERYADGLATYDELAAARDAAWDAARAASWNAAWAAAWNAAWDAQNLHLEAVFAALGGE